MRRDCLWAALRRCSGGAPAVCRAATLSTVYPDFSSLYVTFWIVPSTEALAPAASAPSNLCTCGSTRGVSHTLQWLQAYQQQTLQQGPTCSSQRTGFALWRMVA